MPGIELRRGADELGAADVADDAIEGGGVGGLGRDGARRNPLGIALAVERQLLWVADAKLLADSLPVGVGARQLLLGLSGDLKKSPERVAMGLREALVEDIADDGERSLGAELLLDRLDADQPPEAARLERDGVIPEVEAGVEFAGEGLLVKQRGRAEHDIRLGLEVEPALLRKGAQQQPALVERAAGDAERLAAEVGERLRRRIGRSHDRPERRRIGPESKIGAKAAFARDPEPVAQDDVDRAAHQGDLARLGRGEFGDGEVEAGFGVEPRPFDDGELPGERAGLLDAKAQLFRRLAPVYRGAAKG